MALLNNFADRDPAKFLSGMDPRHAGALLVGKIASMRRNVNPPARRPAASRSTTPTYWRAIAARFSTFHELEP
jgi:hypothetical protein